MTLRCPVCRAENAIGPVCRRCRADLSLLAAVEARREHHLAAARTALGDGRYDEALDELGRAEGLRRGTDVRRARACACLSAGDFASALAEHARAGP
jgi:hypothetical protein